MADSSNGSSNTALRPTKDDQLNVLLAEYQSGREDDRHSLTQQVFLVAASAAAMIAAFAQRSDFTSLDYKIKLLMIVVGLAFGCYIAIFFASATVRHVYLRLVEDAISEKVHGVNLAKYLPWEGGESRPQVFNPALAQLGRAVQGSHHGSRRIKVVSMFFFVAMLTGICGAVFGLVLTIEKPQAVRAIALIVVTLYTFFAVALMWATVFNAEVFVRRRFAAVQRIREQAAHPGGQARDARKDRSLLSYLVAPRIPEAFKATYFLIAAGVGLMLNPDISAATLIAVAVMWVALEPLAYQARYAWNDLRDTAEDRAHLAQRLRGRIPADEAGDQHLVFGSVAVMVVIRLAVAVAIVVAFLGLQKVEGLAVIGTLIVQASCYEALRTMTKSRSGRKYPGLVEWAVYLTVGLGYGVRAGAGAYFGLGDHSAPELIGLMIVVFSLLGTANCMTVWLLEVSTGAVPGKPQQLNPTGALSSKSHVWSLSRYYKGTYLRWPRITADLASRSAELHRVSGKAVDEPVEHAQLSDMALLWYRDVIRFPGFWFYAAALATSSQLGLVLYQTATGHQFPPTDAISNALSIMDISPQSAMIASKALVASTAVALLFVLAHIPVNAAWLAGLGVPLVVAVSTAIPAMEPVLLVPLAPPVFVLVVYLVTRSSSYEANAAGWTGGAKKLLDKADYGLLSLARHALREVSFGAVFKHGAKRHAAAHERLQRKYEGRLWPRHTVQYTLCAAALWAAFMAPQITLLPGQIKALTGSDKGPELGLILAVGALVAVFANIGAGVISDLLRNKAQATRRPLIYAGALGGAAALLLLSQAATLTDLLVYWILMQMFLNIMLSGLVALIPDHVREHQRGFVSGLFGATQVGGAVLGNALAVSLPQTIAYTSIAGLLIILPVPLIIAWRTSKLPLLEPGPDSERTASVRNLSWAIAARIVVQFAITLGTAYLLFYLTANISELPPETAVIILVGLLSLFLAMTGMVVGADSDRRPADDLIEKRKPYILVAGFVVAAGTLILAFVPHWQAVTWAAAIIGVGFGLFATADLALNTQVLTSPRRYASQLGLLNVGNSLPQVFGAAATAYIVTKWGYQGLYVTTALAAVTGCLLILGVKAREKQPGTPSAAPATKSEVSAL